MKSSGARVWWALAAVSLSVLAVGLDGTILSVALPTLATHLDASQSDLTWFSAGYLLVLAATVLPVGLAGDRFGRKKVMLASLAAFGLASLTCALARSVPVFLIGRLVGGLAGAGITVMALSAVVVLFDDRDRPRAVGIYQAANFLALPLGPILGGWMLTEFWWGWVFLINVPVVVVAMVVAGVLVPESRAPERPGVDAIGIAASTAGLVLLVYGLIRSGEHDRARPLTLLLFGGGLAILVGFGFWEHRLGRRPGGRPLVDPALFRSRPFLWGAVLAAVAGLAIVGVLFAAPQFFQGVQGESTLGSGLRLLPLIGGLVLGAGSAGRLTRALGAKVTVTLGFAVLAAGLATGTATAVTSGTGFMAAWMTVIGAGSGLALSSATATALAEVKNERSGTDAGVVQVFNKTAAPFGTAIMGSVLAAVYQTRLDVPDLPGTARRSLYDGLAVAHRLDSPALADAVRTAFVDGLRASLLLAAAIAVLGGAAALVFLPGRHAAPTRMDRTRERPAIDVLP